MHLRSLKKVSKDVSLNDPIGQDKEGNVISLLDVLKSTQIDVIDEMTLNMEKHPKIYEHLSILDDREKEVVVARFGLDCKKNSLKEK